MRLANYVYKRDFLTKEECNKLIEEGKKNIQKASVFKSKDEPLESDLKVRNTNVSFFENGSAVQYIIEKIIDEICAASLDLYGVYITDIEPVQYAEYEKGMFYGWHTDSSSQKGKGIMHKRDISVSLILNSKDEYTGGSLQMITPNCITEDNTIEPKDVEVQEQGTLIIFPSSMIHQVTPVLSGVRKSLVLWTGSNIKFN